MFKNTNRNLIQSQVKMLPLIPKINKQKTTEAKRSFSSVTRLNKAAIYCCTSRTQAVRSHPPWPPLLCGVIQRKCAAAVLNPPCHPQTALSRATLIYSPLNMETFAPDEG